MVQLHKEYLGKGPTKAQTLVSDNIVLCLLEGGFSKSEQTLRDSGREDAVMYERDALQAALRGEFIGTIERLTGRRVSAFVSGADPKSEITSEVFVLSEDLATGDELDVVKAWGERTRRRTPTLR